MCNYYFQERQSVSKFYKTMSSIKYRYTYKLFKKKKKENPTFSLLANALNRRVRESFNYKAYISIQHNFLKN